MAKRIFVATDNMHGFAMVDRFLMLALGSERGAQTVVSDGAVGLDPFSAS